jgi:hypothetical protein
MLINASVKLHAHDLDFEYPNVDFRMECLVRIVILGFVKGPTSYLQNNYNKLDFIIVIDSWY